MQKKIRIGLFGFGFGVVGQGLYDIISSRGLDIEVAGICIKDETKERNLRKNIFTTDRNVLLGNPDINTIVELINDTDAAFEIVSRALASGKNVVSASKKMIALHLPELIDLQRKYGTSLLYEGAVCGSIPIIRNLEEYYDNELLHAVSGIFNGSSNYILTKVSKEKVSYAMALQQAQALGFAETDPTSDVGGFDAKYKLVIAAAHAYGLVVHPDEVLNIGIQQLSPFDLRYTREKGLQLKLVPVAKETGPNRVALFVLPKFVGPDDLLAGVPDEYNGVVVQAAFADRQFFFGKGAGGHPTGSAVLSDITALRYDYRYEYKKNRHGWSPVKLDVHIVLPVYIRYTDPDQLALFRFEDIGECHDAGRFKYVTGRVRLKSLVENRAVFSRPGVFVAVLGNLDDIHSVSAHRLVRFGEQEAITA